MFNDYSCSCGEGFLNEDETKPKSICIIDYCYEIDCERGKCEASASSYSCSCDKGAKNANETNSQSKCAIDYCYDVDCKNGKCENSLNEYICQCNPGSRFRGWVEVILFFKLAPISDKVIYRIQ